MTSGEVSIKYLYGHPHLGPQTTPRGVLGGPKPLPVIPRESHGRATGRPRIVGRAKARPTIVFWSHSGTEANPCVAFDRPMAPEELRSNLFELTMAPQY